MSTTTLDQYPILDSDYHVSKDDTGLFNENGHILLRGIVSAEDIAVYRDVIANAVRQFKTEVRKLEDRDTYGKAFLQITNLWRRDEAVRCFTLARRFAKVAADLMGVDGVRIYHDQALIKEAGGGHTPWHQDQNYWPLDTDKTITMWMPLVDLTAPMGTLTFASGSHKDGELESVLISDESEEVLEALIAKRGYPLVHSGAMSAGDATFHSGWTLHRAPGNQSDRDREAMTIIYFADGARVSEPKSKAQENDLNWLSGCKPGELAMGELNPLVFKR